MRGVRFTAAEHKALLELVESAAVEGSKGFRTFCSAAKKLRALTEPAPAKVNPAPIEEALVRTSRGRVVPLAGQGGYARASVQATQVGATVADAELLGAWLSRQGWWKQGPTTMLTVLTRWPEWLAKARATAPPPPLKEGLDANAGSGTDVASQGAPAGRQARGFR